MLSKKDLENIRQIIKEELTEFLVRTVTIERGPEKQGDSEKVIKEEQWNILEFMAAYQPKVEAAIRGMQEDLDKTKNNINVLNNIMLGYEDSIIRLCEYTNELKQLTDSTEIKELPNNESST